MVSIKQALGEIQNDRLDPDVFFILCTLIFTGETLGRDQYLAHDFTGHLRHFDCPAMIVYNLTKSERERHTEAGSPPGV